MQHQRFVMLIFVVAAMLLGSAVQAASVSMFERFAIVDLRLAGLVNLTTVLSFGSAVALFVGLIRSSQAVQYFDEVVDELHKVTWPTREETLRAATTVVFTALFVALLIGGYDFLWKSVADLVLYGGLQELVKGNAG